MDRKTYRSDLCLLLCGALVWLLADAGRVRAAVAEALALCAGTVIPALFPFMVVSGMLVSLGFGEWLSPRFAGLMGPLFRLPGSAASALLLGFVGGYPIGTRTAADLYREGLLTQREAERLLTFCNNSNPAFLISVLGVGVFGDTRTGIWLWLIHILSALLTGLILCAKKSVPSRSITGTFPCRTVSFSAAFVSAVGRAASGILSVCAFVVVFYVVTTPLRTLGGTAAMLTGTLELFSLTPLLTTDAAGFLLAAFCSGWGGLSVLAQTEAVLEEAGLRLRPALVGKLLQAVLSLVLAVPVYYLVL